MKRLLILYGFEHSGHHAAALALQDAFREMRPDLDIVLLNYFLYASRILERFSTRVFFRMIKSTPRLWDRIYRNPLSEERFTRFRQFVRSWASRGPDDLVREYAPDAIVCTQSFACGMINDFKGGRRAGIPLYAALTDYSVPPYWLYDRIDRYFVASPEARSLLVGQGVDGARVLDSGIPIRLCFQSLPSREKARRILGIASPRPRGLLMGGWTGWGALARRAMEIQRLNRDADLVVVA
ncbi:MAG: hypothetical protein NT045_09240, partial [Candidatus Aureabacteria bacterium]|nr:hypothetical protein [Candidatus Auribacterota bacterium]